MDTWQLLLFKEIFPFDYETKQRAFLIVCSQGELTLVVMIENQYEQNDLKYKNENIEFFFMRNIFDLVFHLIMV